MALPDSRSTKESRRGECCLCQIHCNAHSVGTVSILAFVAGQKFRTPSKNFSYDQSVAHCHGSKKIQLIVFLNTKQRKRAGSGVKLHLFLISILVGSEWSASRGARAPDMRLSGPRSRCGLEEQTPFPACRQPLADR
jgi:hypothetical protein